MHLTSFGSYLVRIGGMGIIALAACATIAAPPSTMPTTRPAAAPDAADCCSACDAPPGGSWGALQRQWAARSAQLLHDESFTAPSPTQRAMTSESVRGFTSWLGVWSPVDDGELNAVVKPAAHSGAADAANGVDATGARLISNRTAAADVVEMAVDLRTTEPAGLLVGVGPLDGEGRWDWYTGYTVELDPKAGQIILRKAAHLGRQIELKKVAIPPAAGEWAGLALHHEGKLLEVKLDGKVVMTCDDAEPLKPARIGIFSRGETRFKGLRLRTLTGGWWDIPFRESDLLARPGDAISRHWEKVQTGTAEGQFALEPSAGGSSGKPGQTIRFISGEGEVGIDNAGYRRGGIAVTAGQLYSGRLQVRALEATEITVSLRSADGGTIYATQSLHAAGGPDGSQRLAFTLTPTTTDPDARFAITLRKPGSVTVGYAYLSREALPHP